MLEKMEVRAGAESDPPWNGFNSSRLVALKQDGET